MAVVAMAAIFPEPRDLMGRETGESGGWELTVPSPAAAASMKVRIEEQQWATDLYFCESSERGKQSCGCAWCCSCCADGAVHEFLHSGMPGNAAVSPMCCGSCLLQCCLPVVGCWIRAVLGLFLEKRCASITRSARRSEPRLLGTTTRAV